MRKLSLDTKIIFLTLHDDIDSFQLAIEAGCKGYLLKDGSTEDVVAGVRAVAAGQLYVSPNMSHILMKAHTQKPPKPALDPLEMLTPSERKIMTLLARGLSSKEIGSELDIHYRTVENHRTNICRKLNLEGANALVRFALQHYSHH